MSVYSRFKRDSDGLRHLVELLEMTPLSRRKKMIDVGMQEDPEYTNKALQYVLSFQDVINLPDLELAEVLSEAPGRFIAYAIIKMDQALKDRFVSRSQPKVAVELKEFLEDPSITMIQVNGAQMKLIEITRKLEKKGLVKSKKIPVG